MVNISFNSGCGFNFSIGNISDYEVLVRAELRIFMHDPDGSVFQPVVLQLYHGNNTSTRKELTPSREGWVVLDILNDIERWRTFHRHERHIHFHVITYPTVTDALKEENGENCTGPLKFYGARETVANTDKRPVLMIYSKDIYGNTIDREALIAAATNNEREVRSVNHNSDSITTARTSDSFGSCEKHTLRLNLTAFNNIWRIVQPHQTALFPTHFNLDICGGTCGRNYPSNFAVTHSFLAYYLHSRSYRTQQDNAQWTQCCAPVRYKGVEALFSLPGDEFRIVALNDISVDKCSCLSVLTSSSSSR